ncbi:hypothetical protein [uncultured Tessaracoccus sp.]|uniref:hypothetical protein n=1 Tax=uncultured Tessaracoccus sp. TaxID=905023 RepID=UPI0025F423EC|nr:hypothetical protein [uncultured Tessaracoccus sp.]
MIVVRGHTLTGLAAAARLARLGHDVVLAGDEAPRPPLDHLELPATWRDLCKKTGRPFAGALNARHLELAPAPATTYLLPDGGRLVLPDGRGAQLEAITHTHGRAHAEQWRTLLDELDDVWAALRHLGLERARRATSAADRRALLLHRTLADLADRAGPLGPVVLAEAAFAGTDSPRAPALLATRLVLARTFGRHRLVDADGRTVAATTLLDILTDRLDERGVRRTATVPDGADAVLDARPRLPRGFFGRPRPALVPHVTAAEPGPAAEVIDLTGPAPVRTIRGEHRALTLDHTRATPDLAAGLAPDDARRWLRRPVPDATHAGPDCVAGGSDRGELLSAALAVYALHERLTGEDPRPTNRTFRMPPLR